MAAGERITSSLHDPVDMVHLTHALGSEALGSGPVFINVGGSSASGKSTIARMVADKLHDAQVLPIDTYLAEGLWDQTKTFIHESPDPKRPYVGGISPEIWDLDLLEDHVRRIKSGETVNVPIFDESKKDRVGYRPFTPGTYIILEGGHSFTPRFYQACAYGILVEAPLHDRLTRKMVRTHVVYGLNDIDEVLGRYLTKDEPVRLVYTAEQEQLADQIVKNPANPLRDYAHLSLPEKGPRPKGHFVKLRPTPETGVLKNEECLGIIQTAEDGSWITYDVSGRRLIHHNISEETEQLLGNHYEFDG